MSFLPLFNVLLVLVGLPLIVGVMALIAAVAGCPELLRSAPRPRAGCATAGEAVWA